MKTKPKPLNQNALKVVQQTREQGATWDAVDDFEALLALHLAAEEITDPSCDDDAVSMLGLPLVVGDCAFYRPTLGALLWIEEYATRFFGSNELRLFMATGWAMAHAHDRTAFLDASRKDRAWEAIRNWAHRSSVNLAELATVIERFMPASADDDSGGGSGVNGYVEFVAERYGQPLSYWLWDTSLDVGLKLVEQMLAREQEKADAVASKTKGRRPPPNPHSQYIRANRAFLKLRNRINAEKVADAQGS